MKIFWRPKTKLDHAGLKAVKLLQAEGFQAFWVGGIVRNLLLKRESDNVDIATDAKPEQVVKILSKVGIKSKPAGKQFGSILTVMDEVAVEITTFRAEGRYSDNRHPDQVEFIKEYLNDAKRRDFTINALYFDPVKKELFDPTKGLKDLKGKLLRFVGDPRKRIDEDHLRMLRAVRLVTQLGSSAKSGPASGWKLESNSFAAIKTRAKYIQGVSGERIKAELDKILLSKNRANGFRLLDQIGLLKFIIPEIQAIKDFSHQSKMYHLEGSIFDHTILALSKIKEQDLDLIYAILFHDIGKPQKQQKVLKAEGWVISTKGHADAGADIFAKFCDKLKFSRVSRNTIEWLIRNHMTMFDFAQMKIQKQLGLAGHPAFELLLKHWAYDEMATKRKQYADDHHKKYLRSLKAGKNLVLQLKNKRSLIDQLARGGLIMKYTKLKPGPEVGELIEDVKAGIVLGKIKNDRDLKDFLKKFIKST